MTVQFRGGQQSFHERKAFGDSTLPHEPAALTVSDKKGFSRWTVSIPQNHSFPLRSKEYQAVCSQSELLRENIAQQSRLVRAKDWRRKNSYYSVDETFLDVENAELMGALPKSRQEHGGSICESSLTYVLDAEDASFGKSLLMLWLSYGLAKKEGRAFFVDDTRWAYGRYTSYFNPPTPPNCVRPPTHHIVPCPHSAKHLVVSAATASWTFGTSFEQEFIQPRKAGAEENRRIYELMRSGYEDLFHITGEDALYSASRIARFKEEAHQHRGSVVGIHLRRGDLHPLEYQFSRDYLPLERYATAARKLLRSQLSASLPDTHTDADDFHTILEYVHSPLLVASDDPEILDSGELAHGVSPFMIQSAQDRIQLATKASLDLAAPAEDIREPGSAYIKHVDENSGWEGGFYRALFFALGNTRTKSSGTALGKLGQNPAAGPRGDATLSEQALRLRELVGRAYLLDLAVLGESEGVVCAVSSATCRVLGVMLGWDAVREGRWVNVDDGRSWSWDSRR